MKKTVNIVCLVLICTSFGFSQGGADPTRGPFNIKDNGVIDGVVVKDEVPVRSKVEYEYVRSSDLVWSRRVFSRIDRREKMNHDIFFPWDFIPDLSSSLNEYKDPKAPEDLNSPLWIRHSERYSLWTIIMRHIFLGDLTVYEVSDNSLGETSFVVNEDGYKFKYPIKPPSNPSSDVKGKYFVDKDYRKLINKKIKGGASGDPWNMEVQGKTYPLVRDSAGQETPDQYLDRLLSVGDPEYFFIGSDFDIPVGDLRFDQKKYDQFKEQFAEAQPGGPIYEKGQEKWITSSAITAYNIKEDWFFDKERSILDRRIIAIAPVARFNSDEYNKALQAAKYFDRFKNIYLEIDRVTDAVQGLEPKNSTGNLITPKYSKVEKPPVELEMFWLYFPELRDVMINYYVYNDQNDAQWMTFDDLFWKRKFSSTIYRVSDKFDREIEDYKFGVDALYEAERLKEKIREWEINVWNY